MKACMFCLLLAAVVGCDQKSSPAPPPATTSPVTTTTAPAVSDAESRRVYAALVRARNDPAAYSEAKSAFEAWSGLLSGAQRAGPLHESLRRALYNLTLSRMGLKADDGRSAKTVAGDDLADAAKLLREK